MLSAGMFDATWPSRPRCAGGDSDRVTAADARGDRHLADDLGEDLAPLGVERTLLVLDGVPLGMSGHGMLLIDGPSGGVYHDCRAALSACGTMPRALSRAALGGHVGRRAEDGRRSGGGGFWPSPPAWSYLGASPLAMTWPLLSAPGAPRLREHGRPRKHLGPRLGRPPGRRAIRCGSSIPTCSTRRRRAWPMRRAFFRRPCWPRP